MQDASRLPQPSLVDVDPEDPSQLLDDAGQYSVTHLDVEALPAEEGEADIDGATTESVEEPDETTADAWAADAEDTGELYGVHTPHAEEAEPEQTADQESFIDSEQGENWLETLGKRAAEYGAAAEEELDVVDNSDELGGHHSTESGDRPVADKGSGGPSGL